jgi:hypothetical protein
MRRSSIGWFSAAVVAGVMVAASPAAGATTRVHTTVHLNHSTIRLGSSATFSGAVSPNLHGRTVYLQRHSSSGWTNIAHRKLTSHSRYSFTIRPAHTGTRSYRIVKPRSKAGTPRSVSAVRRLSVTAKPASNCTSGYRPCIAPGSDVDCAGGSGNGPRYVVGPVYVTGSDPYGLDADGDGVACE